MIEKAAWSSADVVFLDLEDSVTPDAKVTSRENVVWAVGELAWQDKSVGYRVNGLDTPLFYRDVIDVVERVGARLDIIIVPQGAGQGRSCHD
jgi:malyl-CoA/(S)-citramalyl-CoA lyase